MIKILFVSFLATLGTTFASELRNGDVLVQSVPCYVCSLIEIEEGAPYSHSGVVVVRRDGKASVLEAWGSVSESPLNDFLKKRKKDTKTLILRLRESETRPVFSPEEIVKVFDRDFRGKEFDSDFFWETEENTPVGGEKLYCSEFVAKVLNRFLTEKIVPKKMHFSQYRAEWTRYFGRTPPDGQPGLSPSDFVRSPLFRTVGEL
jgi:hypothetical protein